MNSFANGDFLRVGPWLNKMTINDNKVHMAM